MPTFETTQQEIKPSPYVSIPLDAIFQGMGYKQQEYDQTFQEMQGQLDQAASTKAYGQDQDAVKQITDTMNGHLGDFNGAVLTDPETRAKMNSLTSSTSKALWDTGAPQRAAVYDQELAAQKAAGLKGLNYISPSLRKLNKYYSSGKLDPTFRPTANGWEAPDMPKWMAEVEKTVPEEEKPVRGADGIYHMVKFKDPAKMQAMFRMAIDATPAVKNTLMDEFDQKYEGTNWQKNGQDVVAGDLKHVQSMLDTTPLGTPLHKQLDAAYQKLNGIAGSNYTGSQLENLYREEHLNQHIQDYTTAASYLKEGAPELDPLTKLYTEQAIRNQETIFTKYADLAGFMGTPEEEKALTLGKLTLPNGTPINIMGAQDKKNAYEIEKSIAAKTITQKLADKTLDITIGGKTLTEAEWEDRIGKLKKTPTHPTPEMPEQGIITALIRQHPERFKDIQPGDDLENADFKLLPNGDLQIDLPGVWGARNHKRVIGSAADLATIINEEKEKVREQAKANALSAYKTATPAAAPKYKNKAEFEAEAKATAASQNITWSPAQQNWVDSMATTLNLK